MALCDLDVVPVRKVRFSRCHSALSPRLVEIISRGQHYFGGSARPSDKMSTRLPKSGDQRMV